MSSREYVVFERNLRWLEKHSKPDGGVFVSSRIHAEYPEVSGYLIPSLLRWNETKLAHQYLEWLLETQDLQGFWKDSNGDSAYLFDTGQIVRGLVEARDYYSDPRIDQALTKSVNWVVSLIESNGELSAPDPDGWGGAIPIGILLYCLEPIRRAAEIVGTVTDTQQIQKAIDVLLSTTLPVEEKMLTHFHAYIVEALVDLGLEDDARAAMAQVEKRQHRDGRITGYPNVPWVCTTGQFQYAVIWYKLGMVKQANLAFTSAMKMQNVSGGWFGSYGRGRFLNRILGRLFPRLQMYFPRDELSWVNKYFLDALHFRLLQSFEEMAPIFSSEIRKDDGRYQLIRRIVKEAAPQRVLDAGCGKGRFLVQLKSEFPSVDFVGVDISSEVMKEIPASTPTFQGSLLKLPFERESFDLLFAVESLEHAVNTKGALREMDRIVKPGGTIVVLDKNARKLGRLKLPSWEQWFTTSELKKEMEDLGYIVTVIKSVAYEGRNDGLFSAWIGKKLG